MWWNETGNHIGTYTHYPAMEGIRVYVSHSVPLRSWLSGMSALSFLWCQDCLHYFSVGVWSIGVMPSSTLSDVRSKTLLRTVHQRFSIDVYGEHSLCETYTQKYRVPTRVSVGKHFTWMWNRILKSSSSKTGQSNYIIRKPVLLAFIVI